MLAFSFFKECREHFTYHGNLIDKSRITPFENSKSRVTLHYLVTDHADKLGTITHHAANFWAIASRETPLPPSSQVLH